MFSPGSFGREKFAEEENLYFLHVVNNGIRVAPVCIVLAVKHYSMRQKADSVLDYSNWGSGRTNSVCKSKQKDMNQQIWANPLFASFHNSCEVCELVLWQTVAAASL